MPKLDEAKKILPEIKELGQKTFPFFNVHISTLGGENRASIIITLSLDKKSDWSNGIFENSRYCRFYISNGKKKKFEIEQFSRQYNIPKVRKSQTNDLIPKLSQIFSKINE